MVYGTIAKASNAVCYPTQGGHIELALGKSLSSGRPTPASVGILELHFVEIRAIEFRQPRQQFRDANLAPRLGHVALVK